MKISFSPPDVGELEIEQVAEALKSGWITTGPKTKELEKKVAEFCGVNRAVCLGSQTACAEMALRVLGIGAGDEKDMYNRIGKRILDCIIGVISLPFLFVIIVIKAPIIYLNDKGPIFYNALRLGKDGKPFKMFKFRSMMVNAPDIRNEDGSTYNGEDDPRVTRVGKFMRKTSIDGTACKNNGFGRDYDC